MRIVDERHKGATRRRQIAVAQEMVDSLNPEVLILRGKNMRVQQASGRCRIRFQTSSFEAFVRTLEGLGILRVAPIGAHSEPANGWPIGLGGIGASKLHQRAILIR